MPQIANGDGGAATRALLNSILPNAVAFATSVPLDGRKVMAAQTIAATLAFAPAANPALGGECLVRLTADGAHPPSFAGFVEHGSSAGWFNTAGIVNLVRFWHDGTASWYAVSQALNTVPLVMQSAAVAAMTPTKIVVSFPVELDGGAVPAPAAFSLTNSGGADYGSQIPKLFGTMRVAGTVIWATDIREDVHRSGGGKGGAKTTTYAYSASFAVALSARPIGSLGRIWADGKLLRGAGGDWKSETGFRLHLGGEDQQVDPLIAAAEGLPQAPAHRGIAYAVFEGLQLADFGNRIPSLTFEITADERPVAVSAIASELAGQAIAGEGGETLAGFAASGESVRGAVEAMAQAVPFALADDGAVLRLDVAAPTPLDDGLLGAGDGSSAARRMRTRAASTTLPDEIALTYYEPARDYQSGLQRARRDGIGRRAERIELPAALDADTARGLAETALARRWAARERLSVTLPWSAMAIGAGTAVTLDGETWRVTKRELEHMVVSLDLVREAAPAGARVADAGRAVASSDAAAGATVIRLLDLPALDDGVSTSPRLYLAAAGTGSGWRRADVALSLDGGVSWVAAGRTAAPATMGHAVTALAAGPRELFDRQATVEIELLNGDMTLSPAGADALVSGANLALIGDELLQFGIAEQIGATRWRLGNLLRGRRGSDWAIAGHVASERFVLLDAATLLPIDIASVSIGSLLLASAAGPNEAAAPATDQMTIVGRALLPPAPCRLQARRVADGTIEVAWARRSRVDWAWRDGVDAALGEDAERYRLTLEVPGGAARTIETDRPSYAYAAEERIADGWDGAGTLAVTVAQIGTWASSSPPALTSWIF